MCKNMMVEGIDAIGDTIFLNGVSILIEKTVCKVKGHNWVSDGIKKRTKHCDCCGLIADNNIVEKNTAEAFHSQTWKNYDAKRRQEYYDNYNPSGKD